MKSPIFRPSGALKTYLDSAKDSTRLIAPINRMLQVEEPDFRDSTVLHPSEMSSLDWCHRASYFLLSGHPAPRERVPLRLRSIFDEGHAIHAKWQNYIRMGGWLYGLWGCAVCGHEWWDQSPPTCATCGSDLVKYREVPLSNPEMRIAGHADGWVRDLSEDFLIEIKSIGPGTIRMNAPHLMADHGLADAFKNIRHPFASHLRQAKLYLEIGHLMVQSGTLATFPEELVFIYELKMDQSVSEFTIGRDPETTDPLFEAAQRIVAAVDAQQPLPCNLSAGAGHCKKCRDFGEKE